MTHYSSPVIVDVVETLPIGGRSASKSRKRLRSGILYFASVAIGVVLAVLCGAYSVRGSFSVLESPEHDPLYGLPLSPQALRNLADGETIHVTLSRADNKNISTIFQVTAEDLQLSREELLKASMVMSLRAEESAQGWGAAMSS